MKVAIYARYSSENQRQERIENKARGGKEFAKRYGHTVLEDHIYWDEAKSGAIRNRPALDKLLKACEQKEFQAILVDDLSRLSRNNHHLLTLCAQFHPGIGVIHRNTEYKIGVKSRKMNFTHLATSL